MILGPRVLKTGISITVALYICAIFDLEPALIAAVAAIFTLQPSIYKSWRQVLDQLQTNTLGAAIALGANRLFGNEPIAIGLVSILVILICLKMKMEDTIGLTMVTVLAIMSAPGEEGLLFALNRFVIILVGIGSAFLVNIAVMRPKHDRMYFDKVKSVFEQLSPLLRTAISDEMTERAFKDRRAALANEVERLDELFHMFDEERRKLGRLRRIDIRRFVVYKHMQQAVHKGADILQSIEEHYFQGGHSEQIHRTFDRHIESLTKWHENILLGYEGQLKNGVLKGKETVQANGSFIKNVMTLYEENPEGRLSLVLVGSAIFEYGFQLHRLERMVEREADKNKDRLLE